MIDEYRDINSNTKKLQRTQQIYIEQEGKREKSKGRNVKKKKIKRKRQQKAKSEK